MTRILSDKDKARMRAYNKARCAMLKAARRCGACKRPAGDYYHCARCREARRLVAYYSRR